ncbi:hypothetical protein ACFL6S_36835 [Candidatus Poribacteria bacterium]
MKRLIRAILFISLMSLSVVSVSFSDQNVRIEIKDADGTAEKWHHSRNPNRLQFKRFEAVVRNSAGRQIDINIRLIKSRPTNKERPYSKYSLLFITFSPTNLYETSIRYKDPYNAAILRHSRRIVITAKAGIQKRTFS